MYLDPQLPQKLGERQKDWVQIPRIKGEGEDPKTLLSPGVPSLTQSKYCYPYCNLLPLGCFPLLLANIDP